MDLAAALREYRSRGTSDSSVIRSKVEKLDLDIKVDIIISEWMVSKSEPIELTGRVTCCFMNPCWTRFYGESLP